LTIYNGICKKYQPGSYGCKLTDERDKLIRNREKDFNKIYKGRDFLKAVEFMLEYKGAEWENSEMWKYFEIETLFSKKFSKYIEQAIKNKGVPPTHEERPKIPVIESPFNKRNIHA
jgi:uncharacterized phage protein (TIGR02220 family)